MTVSANVSVRINQSNITQMMGRGGIIRNGTEVVAQRLRDLASLEITRLQAIDTGAMRSAMTWQVTQTNTDTLRVSVGPDVGKLPGTFDYPIVVHQGRGPIRPRRAKVLRFRPKGSSRVVYARRVGPAAPKPFLTGALRRLTANDIP